MKTENFDYIVIGSGFGGSVSAMRLSEKGYRVLVLEKGKRYRDRDFAKTNWQIRKYLWAPLLRCFGIQQLSFFREVMVLHGVGVGGGSLVYANTHMEPGDEFYQHPAWFQFRDWKEALAPHYRKARYMLGSTPARNGNIDDRLLAEVAEEMGQGHTFKGVDVGVYYGDPDQPKDPYFGGKGPLRNGCIECAGCMVGCRHNAKNTLDKNYLYFAEQHGAQIEAETLATRIEWDSAERTYSVHTRSSTALFGGGHKTYRAKGLVFSAGVLGTLKLLLAQKFKYKTLPHLSDTLGQNLRTNSESLCGVTNAREKMNHGVAISSVFQADEHTNIELVKFPNRSGLLMRLGAPAAGPGSIPLRLLKMIAAGFKNPWKTLKVLFSRDLAQNGIVLLVMQTLDNSMRMIWKNGRMKMDNKAEEYRRVPAYIAAGQEVMHRFADKTGGVAVNSITEIGLNMASTAHIIGGCPMGRDAAGGVVDERFAVHNYPNMYIVDGSVIPCNPGVNPSLTITALAEWAMEHVQVRDER
ncbi:MAG: GMC family oxidoreductase [Saprospirales bacterium]|nr:GMC family oxidoreductase [Saprospirales bacterium]